MRTIFSWITGCITAAALILFAGCHAPKRTTANGLQTTAAPNQFYFLFLSDVHLKSDRQKTYYGNDSGDAGTILWDSTRSKISSILNSAHPPAFILYTGDLPAHDGCSNIPLRNRNLDDMLSDLSSMSAINHIPLFYLPGNNDALAGNYCVFKANNDSTLFSLMSGYSPYPYKEFNVAATAAGGKAYMIDTLHLSEGYYAAMIMNKLRIICLNSVLWSSTNCGNCAGEPYQDKKAAGDTEMKWLEKQLYDAARVNDKVYLAMHIPPGTDAFARHMGWTDRMWGTTADKEGWQNAFLTMVNAYRQNIAGIFYGHTHMDEFRLLCMQHDTSSIFQAAISCPGISARSDNNPGFKLVYCDAGNKVPVDFATYYTAPNPIVWQSPYTFSGTVQKIGAKMKASIYETLKDMQPADRAKVLDSIYLVKHGNVSYSNYGLYVK